MILSTKRQSGKPNELKNLSGRHNRKVDNPCQDKRHRRYEPSVMLLIYFNYQNHSQYVKEKKCKKCQLMLLTTVDAHLSIPFPHAFSALHCVFYYLPWLAQIKVSNKKTQRNAVNACVNRMLQLDFIL